MTFPSLVDGLLRQNLEVARRLRGWIRFIMPDIRARTSKGPCGIGIVEIRENQSLIYGYAGICDLHRSRTKRRRAL